MARWAVVVGMVFVAACLVKSDILDADGPISDPCNSTEIDLDPYNVWWNAQGSVICDPSEADSIDGDGDNHYLVLFPGGLTHIMSFGDYWHFHAITKEVFVIPLGLQFHGGNGTLTPAMTNYSNDPMSENNIYIVYRGREHGADVNCSSAEYIHYAGPAPDTNPAYSNYFLYSQSNIVERDFHIGIGLAFWLTVEDSELVLHTRLNSETLDSTAVNVSVGQPYETPVHPYIQQDLVMDDARFDVTHLEDGDHVLSFAVEIRFTSRWRQQAVATNPTTYLGFHSILDMYMEVAILGKPTLWADSVTKAITVLSTTGTTPLLIGSTVIYPEVIWDRAGIDGRNAESYPHMICSDTTADAYDAVRYRVGVRSEIMVQIMHPYNYTIYGEPWLGIVTGPITTGHWHPHSETLLYTPANGPVTFEYGDQSTTLTIPEDLQNSSETTLLAFRAGYAANTCYDGNSCQEPCVLRMDTDDVSPGFCGSTDSGDVYLNFLDSEPAQYFAGQKSAYFAYPGTGNLTFYTGTRLIAFHQRASPALTGPPATERQYLFLSAKQVCDVLAADDATVRDSDSSAYIADTNFALNTDLTYSLCEAIVFPCSGNIAWDSEYDLCGVCGGDNTACCSNHGTRVDNTTCICDTGYCGETCEFVISGCGSCGGPGRECCNNQGTATYAALLDPPYTCTCDEGWSGQFCTNHTCGENAHKDPLVPNLCVCNDGFCTGNTSLPINVPPNGTFGDTSCPSFLDTCGTCRGSGRLCCSDNGTASGSPDNYTCACDAGYCGDVCEYAIDMCDVCGGNNRSCCNYGGAMQDDGECVCDGYRCGINCTMFYNRCEQCLLHYYYTGIPHDRIAQEDGYVIVRAQPATFEDNSTLLQCSRSSLSIRMDNRTAGRTVSRYGSVVEDAAAVSIEFGLDVLDAGSYNVHVMVPGGASWTIPASPLAVGGTYVHAEFNYNATFAHTHEHLADDQELVYIDMYTIQLRSAQSTRGAWIVVGDGVSVDGSINTLDDVHLILTHSPSVTFPTIWIHLTGNTPAWPTYDDAVAGDGEHTPDEDDFWYTLTLRSLWDAIVTEVKIDSIKATDDILAMVGISPATWKAIGGTLIALGGGTMLLGNLLR